MRPLPEATCHVLCIFWSMGLTPTQPQRCEQSSTRGGRGASNLSRNIHSVRGESKACSASGGVLVCLPACALCMAAHP